jgi:hypothetical protein
MKPRGPVTRHAMVWLVRSPLAVALLLTASCLTGRAHGQNDWQFPDPYFGILEIEKSHDSGTWRRYRAEVSPAPGRGGPVAGRPAGLPEQPPAQRPNRVRWRTRSRR